MFVLWQIKHSIFSNGDGVVCYNAHMTQKKNILVVADFSTDTGRDFFSGVLDYLRGNATWSPILIQDPRRFTADAVKTAEEGGADGILTTELPSPAVVEALSRGRLPTVVVGAWPKNILSPRTRALSFVTVDDELYGQLAAEHFLRLGAFGGYGYVPRLEPHLKALSRLRERAFRKVLARSRKKCSTFVARDTRAASLDRWLLQLPKPAAVLACGTDLSGEVLAAAVRVRIKIPEELAVLSTDNDELACTSARPNLSSIATDCAKEGLAAARELDRLTRSLGTQPPRPHRIVVKTCPSVIERDSTSPISVGANLVRRAQEYIKANSKRDLRVGDVVARLGVSRRLADLRFKELTGETILSAITRERLAEFARQLRASDRQIGEISRQCGFANVAYLKTLFRRHYGMTPRSYRNAASEINRPASPS